METATRRRKQGDKNTGTEIRRQIKANRDTEIL
jgi:hypothetical protein